jgi:hypothetical protein
VFLRRRFSRVRFWQPQHNGAAAEINVMGELIKSCRLIHNLVMGVCAAIIAFALTPDPAETYRKALEEVQALQSVKRQAYSDYVLQRLAKHREELAEFDHTPFARPGRNFVLNKYAIEPQAYISWPEADAKIGQIVDFFEGDNHAIEYGPGDEQELQKVAQKAINDPHGDKIPKTAVLEKATFVAPDEVPTVQVGDQKLLTKDLPPDRLGGSVDLSLKERVPNHDIHSFYRRTDLLRGVEEYEIDDTNLAGDWLEQGSGIYERISRKTNGRTVLFPGLKGARSEIEAQTLSAAARILQDKLDAVKREIHFLGLTIEESIAVWVGPTTLLLLLSYFYAHLSNLNRRRFSAGDSLQNASWIALFPGAISGILTYSSVAVLPVLSALALLRRLGHIHEWTTRAAIVLCLLLAAMAMLCIRTIGPLRKAPSENTSL